MDYKTFRQKLFNGDMDCVTLTKEYLKRIDNKNDLNAFISVQKEYALTRAEMVDRKIKEGRAGSLAGMIVAVKDILAMKGTRTTCGSNILKSFMSPYSATAIERLEQEDAIIVGKTNMDEFGMGSSNENSAFGPVKNPYDHERIPGGSSGGSAVAVAADMTMTALGTDTGGSVRQPASHTGIVGLRPTYGRVSRYGLIAFASSLDQIGCFAKTVLDCIEIFQVIAGYDSKDSTSSDKPVPDYKSFLGRNNKDLKVGIPKEYFGKGLDDEIKNRIERVIEIMRKSGSDIKKITLPYTDYGIATYYLICTAEASSNLARYDGIRYGLRPEEMSDLDSTYIGTRNRGFGDEVKRRIMLGTFVLSAGYYDAYYQKAQRVRTLIRRDFETVLKECDIIIGPTAPTTAFKIGENIDDPMNMYLSDIYTVSAPLAGVPALTIPIGKDSKGLPIGLQITGKPFGEGEIFGISDWLEKELGFFE
jgi:aspartyl-tRNA(Asn)/glutamyl-tRNA(Gln) amidotransferase subunit A